MKRKYLQYLPLVLAFAAAMQYAAAQEPEKKTVNAVYTDTPPEIDGLMNDTCWNKAAWATGFVQIQPQENKQPSQQTSFKILFDDNNLYLLIRAFDTDPGKISRIISRRDNFTGDYVEVDIDSYSDKQTAFSFVASASGSKSDMTITDDGNNEDTSWNPIWFLKTSIDDQGWIAEIKIPLSQLRFDKNEVQTWGLQITRQLFRNQERSTWQYIPKGSPGTVHLFGEIHGIKRVSSGKRLELMPFTLARMEHFKREEGNPFMTGKSYGASAGLDGKAAISNNFMLDFSFNPDFGQVEADPSEVNLTAFETYFSERRPFFVEGKNIFQFQPTNTIVIGNMYQDNLFYSRRIGRSPQYCPPTATDEYVKQPEGTSIISALKLSGKTKNGLSLGIMESVTAGENALIDSSGYRKKVAVEPLTNYFVGRIQQDFNKGETTVGGMFTAVNRDITSPDLYFLNSEAYTGGLDFRHSWKERTWYLAGNAEFSEIKGKTTAIINAQTSSARYFQRPDIRYVRLDSSRTSLSGYGATFKLGRSSKSRLQFETSVTLRSPGLDFNDIGYMRYSDVIHHGTWVAYYIRNPFFIFNNFYLNTNYWMYWNYSGKLLSFNTNINFNAQFKNLWRINGSVTRTENSISTTLLRGGPAMKLPGTEDLNLFLISDQSKKVYMYAGGYLGHRDEASFKASGIDAGLTVRPVNSVTFSIETSWFSQDDVLQYLATESYKNDPRYIFAELDQKTLGFTFRLNYTFNPELTLEWYGQPFISAGKYFNLKRITNPGAAKFSDRFTIYQSGEVTPDAAAGIISFNEDNSGTADYSISYPDFNFRQFRSNLVLRWEYKPGSTLFLVWSQGRTGTIADGTFLAERDMKGLFGIAPHDVFLVKFSYWFSL